MKKLSFIIILVAGLSLVLWSGPKNHADHNLVFKHYVSVQEALAADNFKLAKSSLELLTKNSEGKLKELSAQALKAQDIEAMRLAFKPLSEMMSGKELPSGLAVAYCPMAKAHWVQKDGLVANPFYGSSMLRCGTIKKTAGESRK